MATAQHPAAPTVRRGVQPLRAGQGTLLSLAQAAFAARHHSHRRISARAPALELRGLKGPVAYGEQVKFLNSLPLVRVLEWVFIFLPILYHGIYGVYIWLRGKSNIVYYPWAGNWMYLAQRYTGLIAFAYIVQHVLRQRFMGISLPENPVRGLRTRCSTSLRIPGCLRSTSSP